MAYGFVQYLSCTQLQFLQQLSSISYKFHLFLIAGSAPLEQYFITLSSGFFYLNT